MASKLLSQSIAPESYNSGLAFALPWNHKRMVIVIKIVELHSFCHMSQKPLKKKGCILEYLVANCSQVVEAGKPTVKFTEPLLAARRQLLNPMSRLTSRRYRIEK